MLKYYLCVLLAGLLMPTNAQAPIAIMPFEEIVIQTDRDIYIPGETIWFKADYLLNGQKPDTILSKVIYVELISLNGEMISQSKYNNSKGTIDGNIMITEGLASGYYLLRAYTQYQRNFLPETFAVKYITLINPAIALTGYDLNKDTITEFAILNWSNTENSEDQIAVRIDPRISYDTKSAVIINQFDDTITSIDLAKNGLGSFWLNKTDTINYFLRLALNNGKSFKRELTTISTVKNHLECKFDEKCLKVRFTSGSVKEDQELTLKVYSRSYFLLDEIKIKDGKWQDTKIQEGIASSLLYLVLTDKDDQLKNIKAIYHPTEPIKIKVKKDKSAYSTRETVNLKITKPSFNEFAIDHLSVSVVKHKTIKNLSDLPQIIIENPILLGEQSQFEFMSKKLLHQIDILLALHSRQLMDDDAFLNKVKRADPSSFWLPEYQGIAISGKVINKLNRNPMTDVDVYIATISDNPQMHISKTNNRGEFISTLKHVNGSLSVFLCIRDEEEENMEIFVNNDYSMEIPTYQNTPLILDTSAIEFVKSLYVNAQIGSLFSHISTEIRDTDTLKPIRFTEPEINIILGDFIALPTLTDVINELVPYARVRKKKDEYYLSLVDDKAQATYENPLVLLDNLPVFNITELLKVDPNSIKQIGVINRTVVYGDNLLKGIVMFESNTNNFGNIELPVSSTFLEFNAYRLNERYVGIEHSEKNPIPIREPDFRNTLYWNPDLEFINDETTVSFSTSDDEGIYDIEIRGITADGRKVFSTNQFRVGQ